MNANQVYFLLTASFAATGWLNIWLSRRYPQGRRHCYLMNLAGLTVATYALVFPAYQPLWMMFFMLNLLAQNPFYAQLKV